LASLKHGTTSVTRVARMASRALSMSMRLSECVINSVGVARVRWGTADAA
jgi:hypothetical protein